MKINKQYIGIKILVICLCSSFFSVIFFIFQTSLWPENETTIDYHKQANVQFPVPEAPSIYIPKFTPLLESAAELEISYIPKEFVEEIPGYTSAFSRIFMSQNFSGIFFGFPVEFYKGSSGIRGKMKNGIVQLFGILDLGVQEFLAVSIHEFGHFVDIYFLEKKVFSDVSQEFYDISWQSTKVILSREEQTDFVSGYAMTNKYEDFAESFTYFVIHNKDFAFKAQTSTSLQQKYDFFQDYIFQNSEYIKTDFSENQNIESYYWDITKIDFSFEKLLRYENK